MKGVIHEVLEGGRGVCETKEHNSRFKEAFMSDEGGLLLMTVFDPDVVVSPSDIKLGKCFGILKFVDEVRDEWKGIGTSGGVFIQVAVVLAGMEASIFLLDKEEGGRLGRV